MKTVAAADGEEPTGEHLNRPSSDDHMYLQRELQPPPGVFVW